MKYWIDASALEMTVDFVGARTLIKIIKKLVYRLTVVMFDMFKFLNEGRDTILEETPIPTIGIFSRLFSSL